MYGAGGGPIALTPVGWLTYHAHRKATFWQGVYAQLPLFAAEHVLISLNIAPTKNYP